MTAQNVYLRNPYGSYLTLSADDAYADFQSEVAALMPAWAAPAVSGFQVNDGNPQRAMIDSLTVTFNESVTLSPNAITLNMLSQTGGSPAPMNFTLNGSGTTWVLTFTDPSYIGGSLPDGAYELNVAASGVSGAGNLNMAANQSFEFFRLYGDFNGDGVVNGADFETLEAAFGTQTNSSNWYLDYDGNGMINGADFGAFAENFGLSMSIPSTPGVALLSDSVALPVTATTTPTEITFVPAVMTPSTNTPITNISSTIETAASNGAALGTVSTIRSVRLLGGRSADYAAALNPGTGSAIDLSAWPAESWENAQVPAAGESNFPPDSLQNSWLCAK
jgi:hypothetical protein